jgi:succinate dehydrogenase / fumarate reductase flavoprotein subunit
VFGRRAGVGAAEYIAALGDSRPAIRDVDIERSAETALAPFREASENPYTLHSELQQKMNDLVGIIRREGEVREALEMLDELDERAESVGVEGHRPFNPGWHLALDLRNMLAVCRCVALAALERTESRGGHTREDFPGMDPQWRGVNLICTLDDTGTVQLKRQPVPEIRVDLLELFERTELSKYLTEPELTRLDAGSAASAQGSDQS